MKIEPMFPDQKMPWLISPENPANATLTQLKEWTSNNRHIIDKYLHQAGVIMIRGFAVHSAEDFRVASAAISPDLRNYTGGDSPRSDVLDKVYTSTEYPANLEVLLHNELSYAGWCPQRVFFCCLIPSKTGGETHIADGREIYAKLDPEVRDQFENKGVTYLQHLWDAEGMPGAGKSWQETFETDDKNRAEQYLANSQMEFQWTDLGVRTAATKPAVRIHEVTGEKCWHNQADQWHRNMVSVKDSVSGSEQVDQEQVDQEQADQVHSDTAGTETLGNHVCYGDGEIIDVEDLNHIREVSRNCERAFPWQRGDIMVIDNVLTMHGRKPYTGDRRVLVSMA